MPNGLIKVVWFTTKWFATALAAVGAVVAVLFLYDLLNRGHWGEPWWLLPILMGISVIAWFLRLEASWLLNEIKERDALSGESWGRS